MYFSPILLFSTLFFLCFSLFPLVSSEDFDESDVTVLTEANFDQFINQDLALVEFYAPCKRQTNDSLYYFIISYLFSICLFQGVVIASN